MSTDLTRDQELVVVRRAALRLAFGVTACFALVEALGWDATFLAPLLTAQMLTKLRQPPSLSQERSSRSRCHSSATPPR
jgi:hypothetical protein